jgi:hypothetical protein
LHILITVPLPNAYQPDEMIELGVRSALPPFRDKIAVHDWLTWRLGRIESHEMREFYRVDDMVIFDPHAVRSS